MICKLLAAAALAGLAGGLSASAHAAEVTGTATYRERMLLPPGAVFEAVLEDVSRADAPAVVLGRFSAPDPGPPPFAFAIAYDPEAIDHRNTYGVRARITWDGQLRFTTDTMSPVLTRGAPDHVDVKLVRIAQNGEAPSNGGEDATADGAPRPALKGFVAYMANAARFTDCRSGVSYPIAMEGDHDALEHAYLAAGHEPGGRIMASFEGRIEDRPMADGNGQEATVIVERFVGVWPEQTCEQAIGDATLANTRWQIVELNGLELEPVEEGGERPPAYLMLSEGEQRFAATVGCNQLVGGYELDGATVRFGQAAATLMACPEPLDQWERRLAKVLGTAAGWRIAGANLELLNAEGAVIATFEAVYRY